MKELIAVIEKNHRYPKGVETGFSREKGLSPRAVGDSSDEPASYHPASRGAVSKQLRWNYRQRFPDKLFQP